jgi:hypothetical protein
MSTYPTDSAVNIVNIAQNQHPIARIFFLECLSLHHPHNGVETDWRIDLDAVIKPSDAKPNVCDGVLAANSSCTFL